MSDEWTAVFHGVNPDGDPEFEVRPIEMTFTRQRGSYAYCKLTFPPEVGEVMQPHTRYDAGRLRGKTPVSLCLNGTEKYTMLFRPDYVTYTTSATYIELHDLQETLDSGLVDFARQRVRLRDAYEYVFECRSDTESIPELKFAIGDRTDTEVLSANYIQQETGESLMGLQNAIKRYEAQENTAVVNGFYAIDINELSPIEAIWKLNELFGVTTWVDSQSRLWVGTPEANSTRHIAAPDDNRVWRYKNVSVSHGREPIRRLVLTGAWVDDAGIPTPEDALNWFTTGGGLTGDVRVQGVAERADINYGRVIKRSASIKRDTVEAAARLMLREEMKNQNGGTVELDPSLSGDFTDLSEVSMGDFIHIVPDDNDFESVTSQTGEIGWLNSKENAPRTPANEIYLVTGVQHTIDGNGHWSVTLDIILYPDDPVVSKTRYFDPQSGDYLTEKDVMETSTGFEDDGN